MEEEEKKLVSANGFLELFFIELRNHPTYRSCYEALEDRRVSYFGTRKYASYESFKTILYRTIKKRK